MNQIIKLEVIMSNNNKLLSKRQLRRKVANNVQTLLSNNVANNADYIDINLKNNHSNSKYKNYAAVESCIYSVAVDNLDGNITFSNGSLKTNVLWNTFPKTARQNIRILKNSFKMKKNLSKKCRLACIGGSNVRNAVMNMLKFIITDKVAINLNWAGRGSHKRPFKDTQIARMIKEAIMTAYGKAESKSIDLGDVNIENAVKDWLKLASLASTPKTNDYKNT